MFICLPISKTLLSYKVYSYSYTNIFSWDLDGTDIICIVLYISDYIPVVCCYSKKLYCTEKDDLGGPWAHWQKTAVCPSSRSALRCPGTLPARRSGPQRGGTIWYQLPSGRGASVPSSLLSVKVMLATWSQAAPSCLSRSYPSCHCGEGLADLETGWAPPSRCAADCLWEDWWGHILCDWTKHVLFDWNLLWSIFYAPRWWAVSLSTKKILVGYLRCLSAATAFKVHQYTIWMNLRMAWREKGIKFIKFRIFICSYSYNFNVVFKYKWNQFTWLNNNLSQRLKLEYQNRICSHGFN